MRVTQRFETLPPDQRKVINSKFKQHRLAGKLRLSYQRWLAKLFEITDAGLPIDYAVTLMGLFMEGKMDALPLPRTSSVPEAHSPSDR